MSVELGAVLREARKLKKLTLTAVAEKLGVSYPAVQQWETGATDPTMENLIAVCSLLEIDVPAAIGGSVVKAAEQQPRREVTMRWVRPASDARAPALLRGRGRNVPVKGTVVGGQTGDFRFNGQDVDFVPRPPGFAHAANIYALYVIGSSMEPKYVEGELVYVDAARIPASGDYVIIELLNETDDSLPGDAFIKRLIKRDQVRVTYEQFNPPERLEVQRSRVKSLHRVIQPNELLGV